MRLLTALFIAQSLPTSTLAAALSTAHLSSTSKRDDKSCGGDPSLFQCGSSFPSDFCCPVSTTCHSLSSPADTIAVLCCPAGQECKFISPIACGLGLQNATTSPGSQFHSDPVTQLESCGDGCCPLGGECHDGTCLVRTKEVVSSSASSAAFSTTASSPTSTGMTTTTTAPTSAPPASTPTMSIPALSNSPATQEDSPDSFSGSSFAAGFLPGILLGALLIALILWYVARRRRSRNRQSKTFYGGEKNDSDDLTDLRPMSHSHSNSRHSSNTDGQDRPSHARTISDPIPTSAPAHRTDFARHSPPRIPEPTHHPATSDLSLGYSASITGPSPPPTPARTPKLRALFSGRSPAFPVPRTPEPSKDPLPSHLKRGTLNFGSGPGMSTGGYGISPIRALRTKKSTRSLRRQGTEDSRRGWEGERGWGRLGDGVWDGSAQSRREERGWNDRMPIREEDEGRECERERSGSTETIQVLMPSREPYTPDQRARQTPATVSTARTTAEQASTGSSDERARRQQHDTPTRIGPGVPSAPLAPAPAPIVTAPAAHPVSARNGLGTPYTSPPSCNLAGTSNFNGTGVNGPNSATPSPLNPIRSHTATHPHNRNPSVTSPPQNRPTIGAGLAQTTMSARSNPPPLNQGQGGWTPDWAPGKVTGVVVGPQGLRVERDREEEDSRRLTTFSSMMERAGCLEREQKMGLDR